MLVEFTREGVWLVVGVWVAIHVVCGQLGFEGSADVALGVVCGWLGSEMAVGVVYRWLGLETAVGVIYGRLFFETAVGGYLVVETAAGVGQL